MNLSPEQIAKAMLMLDISRSEVQAIKAAPSDAEALELLETLKAKAKANFRKLARQLHPDVAGGDREKEEQFKLLASVLDELETIRPSKASRPIHPLLLLLHPHLSSRSRPGRIEISFTRGGAR